MASTIQLGSKVELYFTLTLSDGTLVEETEDSPDVIKIGEGDVVPGLEDLLTGRSAGDFVTEEVSAEQNLFGARDDNNVHIVPLSEFDESLMPEVGRIFEFTLPNGQSATGTITEVDEHVAIIDFNHPLAGRDLIFKAEILSVQNA